MDNTPAPASPHWRKSLLWIVLLLLVVITGSAVLANPQDVASALRSLPLSLWMGILALSCGNYLLRFVRWNLFLRRVSPQAATIPFLRHGLYYLAGFALTLTPGKLGEGMRAVYLKKYGVPVSSTFSVVFAERLMDVLSMLLLALAALAAPGMDTRLLLPAAVLTITLLLVLRSTLPQTLLNKHPRTTGLQPLFAQTRHLLRQPLFYGGVLAGVAGWGLEGYGFFLALEHLQPSQISLLAAVSIYALGVLAGALSFLPGGIGGAEAVMTGLLVHSGLSLPLALAATLVCRLATLWFAVVVGIVACAIVALLKRKPVPATTG
jgi:uncharacterized membrane protein YbhN (UPF0104 family)